MILSHMLEPNTYVPMELKRARERSKARQYWAEWTPAVAQQIRQTILPREIPQDESFVIGGYTDPRNVLEGPPADGNALETLFQGEVPVA